MFCLQLKNTADIVNITKLDNLDTSLQKYKKVKKNHPYTNKLERRQKHLNSQQIYCVAWEKKTIQIRLVPNKIHKDERQTLTEIIMQKETKQRVLQCKTYPHWTSGLSYVEVWPSKERVIFTPTLPYFRVLNHNFRLSGQKLVPTDRVKYLSHP